MKLKRVQNLPSMKLGGTIPGDINEVLTAYAEYYHDVHGDAIKPWSLVVQIVRSFVDEDRAFQAWRRRTNGASNGASTVSGHGSGAESRNG